MTTREQTAQRFFGHVVRHVKTIGIDIDAEHKRVEHLLEIARGAHLVSRRESEALATFAMTAMRSLVAFTQEMVDARDAEEDAP